MRNWQPKSLNKYDLEKGRKFQKFYKTVIYKHTSFEHHHSSSGYNRSSKQRLNQLR